MLNQQDGCLVFSGRSEFLLGYSFANGGASFLSNQLKLTSISATRWGSASAVVQVDASTKLILADYPQRPDTTVLPAAPSISEAYITIGNRTFVRAGLVPVSISNFADDEALNWLGLFYPNYGAKIGVWFSNPIPTAGTSIQVFSDFGNGFSGGAALENITIAPDKFFILDPHPATQTGTAVGVINYNKNGITAHTTLLANGILGGSIEAWGIHTGFTSASDTLTYRAALAAQGSNQWDAMAAVKTTFDIYTIAGAVQITSKSEYGLGISVSAELAENITLNSGVRWFGRGSSNEVLQIGLGLEIEPSETITLEEEVGTYLTPITGTAYAKSAVTWAPGGGITASLSSGIFDTGAYVHRLRISKEIEY